jgi:hypothetical protein
MRIIKNNRRPESCGNPPLNAPRRVLGSASVTVVQASRLKYVNSSGNLGMTETSIWKISD